MESNTEDDNWIYLSDEIILGNFTYETGKDAINNYIKRILKPNFHEEIDYKQVSKNNEFVMKNLKNNELKTSNRKKFFIITKKTYRNLVERRKFSKQGRSRPEKIICERLARELNGRLEVCINSKRIDILTDTEIIEVKNCKNMLSAVGQILYYSKYYPDRTKRIHLFDHDNCRDEKYEELCRELGINITYE